MNIVHKAPTPAEVYDDRFVPALFAHWGPVMCEIAGIRTGDRVLDVACGTGALTRAALERAGPQGKVVGIDPNQDMLAVARRRNPDIDWREGRAEAIPFPDASFDAVASQFGFMFFEDRAGALREMMRVLRPGRRLAVAVCDAVGRSPGYAAFAALLQRLFGKQVADAFRAPFILGDREKLRGICDEAGLAHAEISRRNGLVRFSSIDALVSTERACVWTLGGVLSDDQFARLLDESKRALKPFVGPDGEIAFDMPALIIAAEKR
ncbi:MAG TPA: methyltransferase domain-containing protein [Dongiaceae bacterium]|nr:methyltransferase domain-containing protein [Dongiaceae bacterium]